MATRGPGLGLSPRERGNRPNRRRRGRLRGSIPARAGEPQLGPQLVENYRVYPRASGGTVPTGDGGAACEGLSPRERGNPERSRVGVFGKRSIPARAGEPRDEMADTDTITVYPRASGGTGRGGFAVQPNYGLSPRERGNLLDDGAQVRVKRSIPARAGEPTAAAVATATWTVYPRASGGTGVGANPPGGRHGLSPRERGNLREPPRRDAGERSIPARAGEPRWATESSLRDTVYPRASGGTPFAWVTYAGHNGLSPRERGNPLRNISLQRGAAGPQRTSIPNPARGRLLAPRLCARLAPHQIYAVGIYNCLGSLAECAYSLFPYRCGISPGHHN